MNLEATFWLVSGLTMMLAELLIPGFVVFFFGVGAVITAGVTYLFPGLSPAYQGFLFALVSVGALLVGRRWLVEKSAIRRGRDNLDDEWVGAVAEVCETIEPPAPGRVMLRGVSWGAEAQTPLAVGTKVRVVARENITLKVEAL